MPTDGSSFVATAACLAVSVSYAARAAGPRLARLGAVSERVLPHRKQHPSPDLGGGLGESAGL